MPVFVKKVSECEVGCFRSFIASKLGGNSNLELVKSADLKSDNALREKIFMGQVKRNPRQVLDPKQKYGNFWKICVADLSDGQCKSEVKVWVNEQFTKFLCHKGDFFAVTNASVTRPRRSQTVTRQPGGIIVSEKLHDVKIWVMTTYSVDDCVRLPHPSSSPTLSLKTHAGSLSRPTALSENSTLQKAGSSCENKPVSLNLREPVVPVQDSLVLPKPTHSYLRAGGSSSTVPSRSRTLNPVEHAASTASSDSQPENRTISAVQNDFNGSPTKVLVNSAESPKRVQATLPDEAMPVCSQRVVSQHEPSDSKEQNGSPSRPQIVPCAQPLNDAGSPYIYTKIKDLKPGLCNVIGVVTADINPPSTSKHGDSYITVCVKDQSSPLMLIVTIFVGSKDKISLPQMKADDIIRFHRLKIDSENVNFFGVLKSGVDFCVWSSPEYGTKAPKTIAKTYSYTDEEAAMVHKLALWVSYARHPGSTQAPVVTSFINEPTTTMKNMVKTGYYNLLCQVVDSYQPVSCDDLLIVRVWDSTAAIHSPSVVWELPPGHSDCGMYLNLEKFVVSIGIYGAKYSSVAKELKCGDIILLVNLHVKIYPPNPQYPEPKTAFYLHPGGEKFRRGIRIVQGHQRETFFSKMKDALEKIKAENAVMQKARVNNSSSPGISSARLRSGEDPEGTTVVNESQNYWDNELTASVEQRLWVEFERNYPCSSSTAEVNGNPIITDSRSIRNTQQMVDDCKNMNRPVNEVPIKRMKINFNREDARSNAAVAEASDSQSSCSSFVDMDLEDSQALCTSEHPPVSSGSSNDALDGLPSLRFDKPEDNITGACVLSWSCPESNTTSVKNNVHKEKLITHTKLSNKMQPQTSITMSQSLAKKRINTGHVNLSTSSKISSGSSSGVVDKGSLDLEMLIHEMGESSDDDSGKLHQSKEVSLVSDTESEDECTLVATHQTRCATHHLEPFEAAVLDSNNRHYRFSYEQLVANLSKDNVLDPPSVAIFNGGTYSNVDLASPTLSDANVEAAASCADVQQVPDSALSLQRMDIINKSVLDITSSSVDLNSEQVKEGESLKALEADCAAGNIHVPASNTSLQNSVVAVVKTSAAPGKLSTSNASNALQNQNSAKLYTIKSYTSYKTGRFRYVKNEQKDLTYDRFVYKWYYQLPHPNYILDLKHLPTKL